MAAEDHVRRMTTEELVSGLQFIGGPMLSELVRRGYDVRLDTRNSSSGVPIFVATQRPRVVGE